jgi:hypothetical protein
MPHDRRLVAAERLDASQNACVVDRSEDDRDGHVEREGEEVRPASRRGAGAGLVEGRLVREVLATMEDAPEKTLVDARLDVEHREGHVRATLRPVHDLDQTNRHGEPLLAHRLLTRPPVEIGGIEFLVEGVRVRASRVGQERTTPRCEETRNGARDRAKHRAVVDQLGGEHEIKAGAQGDRGDVRDHERGASDTVRGRAHPDEGERCRRPIDEQDGRPPPCGHEPRKTEPAPNLDRPARAVRHRAGEHERSAPEVRPVRRLRRFVAGEQGSTVDVALQIADPPERDRLTADVDTRQVGLEARDPRPAPYCHSRGAVVRDRDMEDMVRQTDQLINFTREINRRIADSGISGVDGLVALYDQLRSALAKVSPQELDWAQGEVNRVLESLRRLSDELQHLAALKASLETGH